MTSPSAEKNTADTQGTVGAVRAFWNAHPCGANLVSSDEGTATFFKEAEHVRYTLEPHILEVVPFDEVSGKRVLEIGCGLGTDGSRFAASGADYQAVDLTERALEMTQANFSWRGLKGAFTRANAETLPFPDASFDLVYSHGVIHHIPKTAQVVQEIHRVLRPGGKAVVMVYHRRSYNYYLNILFFRRLGALLLRFPGGIALASRLTGESPELLNHHRQTFIRQGWGYLKTDSFLSANTDGPGNPLSKVYSRRQATELFKSFRSIRTEVRYLNRRRIPVIGKHLPESWHQWLSHRWGWHLYILAEK